MFNGKIELLCFFYECADVDCRYDSLTIYSTTADVSDNQTKHLVGTYCGTNVPLPMTFKDSVMMIFKTDDVYTFSGFEIQYAVQSNQFKF